jgi:hypothetical protein
MNLDPRLSTLARAKLAVAQGDITRAAVAIDRELASKTFLRIALISWFLNALTEPAEAKAAADAKPDPNGAGAKPTASAHAEGKEKPKEPRSRRKAGAHRRPTGMPSAAQKAGALTAATELSTGIFSRKLRGGHQLRNIKVRELRAIVQESGHAAGRFIMRGYEDVVDAMLCRRLADHCVTSDPDLAVPDIVTEAVAMRYFKEAKLEAARFLQHSAERIANELASASTPPTIDDAA